MHQEWWRDGVIVSGTLIRHFLDKQDRDRYDMVTSKARTYDDHDMDVLHKMRIGIFFTCYRICFSCTGSSSIVRKLYSVSYILDTCSHVLGCYCMVYTRIERDRTHCDGRW